MEKRAKELEAQLGTYRDQLAAMKKEPVEQSAALQQKNDKLAEIDREITVIEMTLANLRQHYRDTYPDVQTQVGRLTVAKARREEILKEESTKKPDAPAAPRPQNP